MFDYILFADKTNIFSTETKMKFPSELENYALQHGLAFANNPHYMIIMIENLVMQAIVRL